MEGEVQIMEKNRISAMKQFKVLFRQYTLILLSDKKNLMVSLLFPVIASVIVIWIAGENMFVHYNGTKSASFVLVSAAIWGGLFNSMQTVVKERASIKRDYITGLRLRCYTASRAIIQFILCALQSAIISTSFIGVTIKYDNSLPKSGVIFGNSLVEYYISILLLMYAADMMGLMISSVVKKTETANVLAPYILIVQLIFSGVLFEMKGVADKISYVMLSRWGMESLGSISGLNDMPLEIQLTMPQVPHEFEAMFETTKGHLLQVWAVLLGFSMLFVILGNIFLHTVAKDTR